LRINLKEHDVPIADFETVDTSFQGLNIRPVAGNIGGEVLDIKLSSGLSDEQIDALHGALVKYKVLFFRAQDQLDDASHEAFGARFGKVVAHPTVPAPEGTKLFELDAGKGGGRADSWHTDVTFLEAFPKLCILRGVKIPAYGGDTVWANTALAYERLPEDLKRLADNLWAVHSNDYDYGAQRVESEDARIRELRLRHHRDVFVSSVYEAEHPLVHVHPVSGERALLLGHFIKRISGLSNSESARVFEVFQNRVTRLENTVRWQWRQNDVAIWDNRATQHYAINDYGTQARLVRRVSVAGERSVSVDGRFGRTLRAPKQGTDASALSA
jgi:alpha-ketoglutarate-dependent sulfate ester dioxygenase